MTQDVTDGPSVSPFGCLTYGFYIPDKNDCEKVAILYQKKTGLSYWYQTVRDLMLAGFCLTLMAGCSLTYKGPTYDLSTLAELRSEPIRHRSTDGMLSQQRDRQRDLLP